MTPPRNSALAVEAACIVSFRVRNRNNDAVVIRLKQPLCNLHHQRISDRQAEATAQKTRHTISHGSC